MKTKTKRNWDAIIATFQESGLSASAYCKRHGLPPSCFYKYRRRFLDQGSENGPDLAIPGVSSSPVRPVFTELAIDLEQQQNKPLITIRTPKGLVLEIRL